MKPENNKIELEKVFAKKLGLRTSAQKLFDILNKNSSDITLDFKNIEFMSRAFAQEYVYQKHKSEININEINMDKFVKDMLNAVENNFKELSH